MPKFPIVGMQFRVAEGTPAPTIMSLLPPGSPLYLEREPQNAHDPNAIQVWIKDLSSVIPESLDDIKDSCVDKDGTPYPCPDLSQPLMLGYIKAKTISEDVQGSDELAPKIDALVAAGGINAPSEIPCELVYGESGRPALKIVEQIPDLEAELSADAEADRDFLAGGMDDEGIEEELDLEDISAGEPDEYTGTEEEDR